MKALLFRFMTSWAWSILERFLIRMFDDNTLFGQECWSAAELAEALLISSQRVNQLQKEGVLPQPRDGRYLARAAVPAYVKFLQSRIKSRSTAEAAVRKLELANELTEIKLKKVAGQLVPLQQVKDDWFRVGRQIRDSLLNLPSRLSGPFAAESNQDKIFESFTKEIHAVLTELSGGQPSKPATVDLPVEEASAPERSPDETGAMGEAGDHDVQARDLEREVEPSDGRFPTGD